MTTIYGITPKPCPFCGRDNLKFDQSDYWAKSSWVIACQDCACTGPASFHLHDAIELWNKRVTPPKDFDRDDYEVTVTRKTTSGSGPSGSGATYIPKPQKNVTGTSGGL